LDRESKILNEAILYSLKDFLTLMGGLMKGLTVFFFLMTWPFREILYYKKLVNEMFVLCDK
jgi:hypothetical protein